MIIEITGRNNLVVTEPLKALAEKKLTKLSTFDTKIYRIHIVFKLDNNEHHASATVYSSANSNLHAEASSKDMYKTIDLLFTKLSSQAKS